MTAASGPVVSAWPHLFTEGAAGSPVLISLHGTGGTEHDGVALARELDPTAGIIAPRGRVSEQGMNRWFRRLAEGVFDVDDVEAQSDVFADFIRAAVAEYKLEGRMLVVVGFSNGANMALATAIRHPELVGHAMAFSGMYPFGDRDLPGSLDALRVLLLNGRQDAMAPYASVTRLAQALAAAGADVERFEWDGGHGITRDELLSAREWLAGVAASR